MKPKLLLLSVYWNYINKTEFIFMKELGKYFNIIVYGPGHIDTKDIKINILEVLEQIGEVDLILIDELLTFRNLNLESYKLLKKINRFYFNLEDYIYNKSLFPVNLDKVDIPVFVILLMSDYYNFSEEQINTLQNISSNSYYICWGEDFLLPKEEMEKLEKDGFCRYVNNNIAEFVRRNKNRIIPMLHMVDSNEFLDFSDKKYEWCVPGADYYWRRKIKQYFRESGIKYVKYTFLNYILRRLDAFQILRITKYDISMSAYYDTFRRLVNKSWCSFTCGSTLRYPVRKYFEIPAFSSLLVCNPCASFEKLGFKDAENCFEVENLDKMRFVAEKTKDKELVAEMIIKGQSLVREKHTSQVRARQFFNMYNIISQKNFDCAFWIDGDIYCRTKNGKTGLV